MRKNLWLGGFTAVNTGKIENCYSLVDLSPAKQPCGGFAGRNSGEIANSYCRIGKGRLTGGFVGDGIGGVSRSYFFHSLSKKSKKLSALSDAAFAQRTDELQNKDDAASLGFDTEKIWEYDGGDRPLRFLPSRWMYDASGRRPDTSVPLVIRTADELWDFADRVNKGDREAMRAHVVLDADVDLGGKEWIPIGRERTHAFAGLFDGRGHGVSNFTIKDESIVNKGFFGFLTGEVYNLAVDCRIKANGTSGALVASCEGGVIGCCAAVVELSGKNADIGGLAGHNSGRIFRSFAAGRVQAAAIALVWWLLLADVLVLGCLVLMLMFKEHGLQVFAPVPYDDDQVRTQGEELQPNTENNFVSFQFEQEIDVDLASGLCAFNFKNPGNSNHNIVVQLQFSDAQAIRVMGSTGRTPEAQAALEASPDYDPESYRTVLAESGSIRPGYELSDLRIKAQPNGAQLPPGEYNAVIYLMFYDINTNNRAMLESQLPVQISVH